MARVRRHAPDPAVGVSRNGVCAGGIHRVVDRHDQFRPNRAAPSSPIGPQIDAHSRSVSASMLLRASTPSGVIVASAVIQPALSKALDGSIPLGLVPTPCGLGDAHRKSPRRNLKDETLARRELVRDQQRDVDVAAPFADHCQLLPQSNQRIVGQRDPRRWRQQAACLQIEAGNDGVDQRPGFGDLISRQVDTDSLERPADDSESCRLQ